LGFVRADRDAALAMLERDEVAFAGCHGRGFPRALGPIRLARIHLVMREVGLVARGGRPVPELAALAKCSLAYRPQSAAIVVHFERAVASRKLDLRRVLKRAMILDSHLAVATHVAAGRADVGLTTHAWAHRLGLEFRAIASESYGLLVRASALADPPTVRLCEVAQGRALRDALAEIPGYDISGIGTIRYDVDDENDH
jgi:molybdate-binding protein